MADQRINILGASGSGTSTTGQALAAALSLPYFDSDDYFHGPSDPPFQNPRSPQQRYDLITADLQPTTRWVLGGVVDAWKPYPQLEFTMIAFLWVPTSIRIERLRRREYQRFGQRILPGGDMHAAHEAFIAWAARYDIGGIEGRTLARHEAYLKAQACTVIEIREERSTTEIIAEIMASLP